MKHQPSKEVEAGRLRTGEYASPPHYLYGCFNVTGPRGDQLRIMSSDGDGSIPWEHVSVSLSHRCPTWEEMDWVKRQFWRDDECVMQLHVPRVDHVNYHSYCLHLWKPTAKGVEIPRPPAIAVGPV